MFCLDERQGKNRVISNSGSSSIPHALSPPRNHLVENEEYSNRTFNNAAPSQPVAPVSVHGVSSLLRRYVMRHHEPLGPGECYAAGTTVAGEQERERRLESGSSKADKKKHARLQPDSIRRKGIAS